MRLLLQRNQSLCPFRPRPSSLHTGGGLSASISNDEDFIDHSAAPGRAVRGPVSTPQAMSCHTQRFKTRNWIIETDGSGTTCANESFVRSPDGPMPGLTFPSWRLTPAFCPSLVTHHSSLITALASPAFPGLETRVAGFGPSPPTTYHLPPTTYRVLTPYLCLVEVVCWERSAIYLSATSLRPAHLKAGLSLAPWLGRP